MTKSLILNAHRARKEAYLKGKTGNGMLCGEKNESFLQVILTFLSVFGFQPGVGVA